MSSNFTAGPWRVDPFYPTDIQTDDGGLEIASTNKVLLSGGVTPSEAITFANARLIAAAPELLAVAELVDDVSDRIDHDPDSAFGQLVAKARAAIAKATGAE